MRCTILLLFILSLGASDLAAQNRRLRQPAAVVEVSAPAFSWEEAFGPEKMLDPKSVCAPYFNFGPDVKACPFDRGVTLPQTPLAGVRGFLSVRLKEGTTVLKSWPVVPESVVVRFGDGHVEVHTRFARLNTK